MTSMSLTTRAGRPWEGRLPTRHEAILISDGEDNTSEALDSDDDAVANIAGLFRGEGMSITSPILIQDYEELAETSVNGEILKPFKCVELRTMESLPAWVPRALDSSRPRFRQAMSNLFMKIVKIIRTEDGQVRLRGFLFARQKEFYGILNNNQNELCQIVLFTDNTSVQEERDGIIEVPIGDVLKLRKLIITNAVYPKHSYEDRYEKAQVRFGGVKSPNLPPLHHREEYFTGILVCRWKKSIQWASTRGNHMPCWSEISLTRMAEADVQNPSLRELDDQLRMDFRGPTSLGGSETAPSTDERMMDSLHSPAQPKTLSPSSRNLPIARLTLVENDLAPGRRYSFGDSFCGAGGVSRGAKMAGLAVKWAFDKWDSAMQSYLLNFSWVDYRQLAAHEWIQEHSSSKVDILHLSPPCQPFSPAKTVAASSDEENQAALCSVMPILEKCLPRVVTIEQTSGLANRHPIWFNGLINQLTTLSYSLLGHVIFQIPDEFDLGETKSLFRNPRPVWNPFRTPVNTITTSGGQHNYHPNGRHPFTLRELACLQTFPLYHKFMDSSKGSLKKQIGNAVPPVLAKVLLETIKETLTESDRLSAQRVTELVMRVV
ncbi:MAG: hypothetical protein M1814_002298 [Vezdaea aestivalis]|nr:MAG: hypothetical protein M1814_002298 [Vezdaea aestivalis]